MKESYWKKRQLHKRGGGSGRSGGGGGASADTSANSGQTLSSDKEIEQAINASINRLEDDSDGLIPIYKVREELGDTVSRSQFDAYLFKMQQNDKVQLIGGEMTDATDYKLRNSVVTTMGANRYYIKPLTSKDARETSEAVNKKLKGAKFSEIGSLKTFSKGASIKSETQLASELQALGKKAAQEFPSFKQGQSVYVPKEFLSQALGSRIKSADIDSALSKSFDSPLRQNGIRLSSNGGGGDQVEIRL